MLRSTLFLLVICLISSDLAAAPATQPTLPPGVKRIADLKYGPAPGIANLLDLYVPTKSDAPRPLIVCIHGGGWLGGNKAPCPFVEMANEGYVVASINYRFSNEAPFPAQIYDCKGAIRWLRAHAVEYGIDRDRIGIWGASAGGHLVALLGTSGDVKKLEGDVGGNLDQSSRVQAVCDFFGPTDMSVFFQQAGDDNIFKSKPADSPINKLFGGTDHMTPQLVADANPITFVSKDDPPFLIMHGDQDHLVPLAQSQMLADALKSAGVSCDFQILKGAGHGNGFGSSGPIVKAFFKMTLKKE